MTPNVRIYSSEQSAKHIEATLEEEGFDVRSLLLASELEGKEEEAVDGAVRQGTLPDRQRKICVRSLKEGHSLVAVLAPFGRGLEALELMESGDTVYSDLLRRYQFNDPAPLSAMMCLPVLAKFVPSTGLVSSKWALTSGFGLLSNNPTPLSSAAGVGALSATKKDWTSSFGFPLLSQAAAPLSSMFALPTLSRSKSSWTTSFGFPLLSKNPAPLSSLLGAALLTSDPLPAQSKKVEQPQTPQASMPQPETGSQEATTEPEKNG